MKKGCAKCERLKAVMVLAAKALEENGEGKMAFLVCVYLERAMREAK